MFGKKETGGIILAILTLTIVLSLAEVAKGFSTAALYYSLKMLGYSAIIIIPAVFARKICARSRDIEVRHSIWKFQRYNLAKRSYFRVPIPMGMVFPLLLSIVSTGAIKCFALLQFDAAALPSKVAKKYGGPNLRVSEVNEADLGMLAFWALVTTLAVSLAAHFLAFADLAKYALYYCLWNLIPFGQLDGMKLLMSAGAPIHESTRPGSTKLIAPLYFFAWILTLIVLFIVIF